MKRNSWKLLVAVGVVGSLLFTTPGVPVLAAETAVTEMDEGNEEAITTGDIVSDVFYQENRDITENDRENDSTIDASEEINDVEVPYEDSHEYYSDGLVQDKPTGSESSVGSTQNSLVIGTNKVVVESDSVATYSFIPNETGYYHFYTVENDTYGPGVELRLNGKLLGADYEDESGHNFSISAKLLAGVKYTFTLTASFWDDWDHIVIVEKYTPPSIYVGSNRLERVGAWTDYCFAPIESGVYRFTSSLVHADIYDGDIKLLSGNIYYYIPEAPWDDYIDFSLFLEAGKNYIFRIKESDPSVDQVRNYNVEITKLNNKYGITINDKVQNGIVNASCTVAKEGEIIELSGKTKSGYYLSRFVVNDEEGNEIEVSGTSFIMPGRNVIVSAEFVKSPPHIYTGENTVFISVPKSIYYFTPDEDESYKIESDVDVNIYVYDGNDLILKKWIDSFGSIDTPELKKGKTYTFNIIYGDDPTIMEDMDDGEVFEAAVLNVTSRSIKVGDNVTAKIVEEDGKNILYFNSKGGTLWHDWRSKVGESLEDVNVIKLTKDSTKMYLPQDSSELFMGYGWNEWDGCYLESLEQIDTEKIDTSKVTNMHAMFISCTELKTLDLRSFDTSNVTDMGNMFRNCNSITNLYLSSFNTSKVSTMQSMFCDCKSLTTLDLSNFNTSNVTDMLQMFYGCSSLTFLELSKFDTLKVTDMTLMFSSCENLNELDISCFNTSNVTSMSGMFLNCKRLKRLDLSNFDTSKVLNMGSMFGACESLTSLDVTSFDTSNVEDMEDMFGDGDYDYGCRNLKTLDLSNFDTSRVVYMRDMFRDCRSLTYLDISGFNTSKVSWVNDIFYGCSSLEKMKTPKKNVCSIYLPIIMFDELGNEYTKLPTTMNSITLTREAIKKVDISKCAVIVSPTSFTYNGKAKKPTVTVKNGETVLEQGVDYEIRYENNKNAGTATVKVTGIGKYQGENSAGFTIKKAASKLLFANESVSKNSLDEAFTNDLTKTTDGTITFTSSDEKVATVDSGSGLVSISGSGTATITANAAEGKNYEAGRASYVLKVIPVGIEKASVAGVSLSYGYSGKAYTPEITVTVDGITLTKDTDYTVKYENNKNPGTAKITITGKEKYTGTRIKNFEIVDCVSSLVSGKTYQLIPKNNSKTAVCSYSGKMVNNTKVYITDRSNSEAMKFKAVKNSDGTWKFINAKCELALAVQQNSSEVGKGTVLYDQTTKKAQNWKLSKKSDNSFAIMNAVTGYSIAMSDASAVKGTTLSMAETASSGLQRFYIAETSAVSTPFDGTYGVKASKDKKFALNIASSSKSDGANVNLYSYSNVNAKKFKVMYSGGGYYRLVNVNSGMCLTVKGNAKTDGANVVQSSWSAADGQRWKITKNSDGTVTMKNVLGTVLHLSGNKTANGTNVMAKTASSTKAQRWYLE